MSELPRICAREGKTGPVDESQTGESGDGGRQETDLVGLAGEQPRFGWQLCWDGDNVVADNALDEVALVLENGCQLGHVASSPPKGML